MPRLPVLATALAATAVALAPPPVRADAEAVLSAARARRDAASLCQAYFYIGEDYYTRGKLDEARKSWEKATAQGAAGAIEDGTARLRLRNASAKCRRCAPRLRDAPLRCAAHGRAAAGAGTAHMPQR